MITSGLKWTQIERMIGGLDLVLFGGGPGGIWRDRPRLIVTTNNHRIDGAAIIYHCGIGLKDARCEDSTLYFAVDITTPDQKAAAELIARAQVGGRFFLYANQRYAKANPYGPDFSWLNNFNWELGTKALTGILAVKHLLSFSIRSLYITGMDFYRASWPEYRRQALNGRTIYQRDAHELVPQMRWLRRVAEIDRRVICDEALTDALQSFERELA